MVRKTKQILQSMGVLRVKGGEGISSQPSGTGSTPERSRKVIRVAVSLSLWKPLQTSVTAVWGSNVTRPRVDWWRGKCEI